METIWNTMFLQIGRQGENGARVIRADVSQWLEDYPSGEVVLFVTRPTELTPYIPDGSSVADGILSWTVSGTDTGIAGTGRAELRLMDGDTIVKSEVVRTTVEPCLPGTDSPVPPTPEVTDWVTRFIDSAETVDEALENADAAAAELNAAISAGDVYGLKNTVEKFVGAKQLRLTWNNGYIKAADLSFVNSTSTTSHCYSDAVLIPAGTMLYVPRVNKSTSVVCLTLCDSDGTPQQILLPGVASGYSTGAHILYPIVEDTWVRFSGNHSMEDSMTYYAGPLDRDFVFSAENFDQFNVSTSLNYNADRVAKAAGISISAGMMNTDKICLPKGMTLEYWGCGSGESGVLTVFQYPPAGSVTPPINGLVLGASTVQHGEYTATEHMYVRLCARVAPNDAAFNVVLPEDVFKSWRIYYKPTHAPEHVKNSPLYGKKLTVMGDSLIYGNKLGPGGTWSNTVALKYGMAYENLGKNGDPVGHPADGTGMVDRLDSIPADTDYFVLDGGANDRNDRIPLGEDDSTDTGTFCGALNTIITAFRQKCPRAKFLLLTNWQRFAGANSLGLTDLDYVNAMLRVAALRCVPVFDNYHGCGITFFDENQLAWIDEAKDRQKLVDGQITYYENVKHFSLAAFEWLTPLYEKLLEGL